MRKLNHKAFGELGDFFRYASLTVGEINTLSDVELHTINQAVEEMHEKMRELIPLFDNAKDRFRNK